MTGLLADTLAVAVPMCSAEAFNRLAEGLALLALQPGGVAAFRHRWEAAP